MGLTRSECFELIKNQRSVPHDSFVYSVCNNNKYCRPSCKCRARSMHKFCDSDIHIFDNCHAADIAGLVACKRCKPNSHQDQSMAPAAKVHKICASVLKNPNRKWEKYIADGGFAKHHGHRTFRYHTNLTVNEFIKLAKLDPEKARQLVGLDQSRRNLTTNQCPTPVSSPAAVIEEEEEEDGDNEHGQEKDSEDEFEFMSDKELDNWCNR